MLIAEHCDYKLLFNQAGGTSRGVLYDKETHIIRLYDDENPRSIGYGEAAIFRGLSSDDRSEYVEMLTKVCRHINDLDLDELKDWSSILFGLETAIADYNNAGKREPFSSDFNYASIPINGLVWMGNKEIMRRRIDEKLNQGFKCIKIKIGAIDFASELELIKYIRNNAQDIIIRLDANGAYSYDIAMSAIEQLAKYNIHSIEQPIQAGNYKDMERLVINSPIDIALDEELIGINNYFTKKDLLSAINPKYIILKPSLMGGFRGADEWISLANKLGVKWWITSALESNIGLNAIARYTYKKGVDMPQGLGTGGVFSNNFDSPLYIDKGHIKYDVLKSWDFSNLDNCKWR